MKTFIKPTALLAALFIFCSAGAQDINFSQFYDLPLLRNPALAGIFDGNFRITSGYRNQWQSVTVPYRTVALGVEYKKLVSATSGDFVTFGLQATNDAAGDSRLSRTQLFPVVNYHKSLSADKNTYLSAGFMAGPVVQSFDPSQLKFDDQYVGGAYSSSNPTRQSFNTTRLTYWDAAAGLCFSSSTDNGANYYISFGLFHFTKPTVSFREVNNFRLHEKYVINAGYSAQTSEHDRLIFYADFFKQGGAEQAQGGAMLRHDLAERDDQQKISITGGLFYRLNDAFIPVIKLDYYNVSMGATYDINVSKLTPASFYRGGLEITLSYKGGLSFETYDKSSYQTKCPTF